jgi:hypothetical protein
MNESKYAKHGGVHFTQKATEQEINTFVAGLTSSKRDNLFEVLGELDRVGLILIVNDGAFADGEGKLEGSAEC